MNDNSEVIQRLNAAFGLRSAGDYAGALSEFESLERQSVHPQDIALLRFFQTTCLTDMGKPKDALKRLSQVDKSGFIFSNQVDYEYEKARIERALGHTREALNLIDGALKLIDGAHDRKEIDGVSSNLYTMQGILLAESGNCDEAFAILEGVPIQDAGWAEAKLHLGDCKYKKRLYREAIDCYMSIVSAPITVHPFYREAALRNMGYAHYDLGEFEIAVKYLQQVEDAYDDAPDMKADLFRMLASAYSRLGMAQEAAKYGGFSTGTHSVH